MGAQDHTERAETAVGSGVVESLHNCHPDLQSRLQVAVFRGVAQIHQREHNIPRATFRMVDAHLVLCFRVATRARVAIFWIALSAGYSS
jgi:hypothetical protein